MNYVRNYDRALNVELKKYLLSEYQVFEYQDVT